MKEFATEVMSYWSPGHFEGLMLYFFGALTCNGLQVKYRVEVMQGLKGHNGLFEGPEQLLWICLWVWPHIVLSSGFLQVQWPDMAWYTLWIFTLYGLTGRWGLEWLLAFRRGTAVQEPENKGTKGKTEPETKKPEI